MSEGKDRLVESDVTRDDYTPGLDVKTSISFVGVGVAEKDTRDRAWGEFMWRSSGLVGVA